MSGYVPPRFVVAAAIVVNGRILAQQRAFPVSVAGFWELPGGRVEPGESIMDALVRECDEELGVAVRAGVRFGPPVWLHHDLVLLAVTAALVPHGPAPSAREHAALRWLGIGELDEVSWLPADLALLPWLRIALSARENGDSS